MDLGVGEAQAGDALTVASERAFDRLEGGFGEHTVVAETFEPEQSPAGGKADLAQFRQVGQPLADAEVVSVVDRGLCPERSTFLVVLLDARPLVIDLQRRRDPLGQDAGLEASGGGANDPAVEDQLDLIRAAEVEVLANDLLAEQATMHGLVEHLGERELGLQDGDVVAIAGVPVGGGEGMGQTTQPLAQQGVDLGGRQVIADHL